MSTKASFIGGTLPIESPLKLASVADMQADRRIGVLTVQCKVPGPIASMTTPLVTSEQKWLLKTALDFYILALGLPHEIVNNHLAIDAEANDSSESYENKSYQATVEVHTGSRPPNNVGNVHRTLIRTDKCEKSHWRWISLRKTLVLSKAQPSVILAARHKQEQGPSAVRHDLNVTFEFTKQSIAIGDVVRDYQQYSNEAKALQNRDIINFVLHASTTYRDDVLAGHQVFRSTDAVNFHGLEYRGGLAQSLHSTGSELVLSEVPCDKLYFKAQSVASFMQDYLGGLVSTSAADIAKATERSLRGIKVKVIGGLGPQSRHVIGIAPGDTTQLSAQSSGTSSEQTLAQYYASKGVKLLFPSLPCINVGTTTSAIYVPAELCLIAPGQAFVDPLSPALQKELSSLKKFASSMDQEKSNGTKIPATPLFRPKPSGRAPSADVVDKFKVVFVAVGPEVTKMRLFQDFSSELASKVRDYKVGTVEDDTLILQHPDDVQSPQIWQYNLARYASDTSGRQVIFVIGQGDYASKSATQKDLMQICDQHLGAQCLFISASDLRTAAYGARPRSMNHFAGQQLSRIFACNPVDGSSNHLSMGLHITPLSRPQSSKKVPRADGESWHLVAFSARAAKGSQDYHHSMSLHKIMTGEALDISLLFSNFLQQIRRKRHRLPERITVFRSGAMVPLACLSQESQSEPTAENGGLDHELLPSQVSSLYNGGTNSSQPSSGCSATFDRADFASNPSTAATSNDSNAQARVDINGHKPDQFSNTSLPSLTKFETLQKEADGFTEVLKGLSPNTDLVYYHAAEQQSFRLPRSTINDISQRIEDDVRAQDVRPTLFLHDKKLTGLHDAVGVLSAFDKSPEQPLIKLTIIRHDRRTGTLSATEEELEQRQRNKVATLRRQDRPRPPAISDTPNRRPSTNPFYNQIPATPSRAPAEVNGSPLMTFGSLRQSFTTSQSTVKARIAPATSVAPTSADDMIVSNDELQILNEAFHDDRLKLHRTKWPIPTYLAQKASKRAILNMESDHWNEGIATAPYKLHEVHEKLRNTLYFLT